MSKSPWVASPATAAAFEAVAAFEAAEVAEAAAAGVWGVATRSSERCTAGGIKWMSHGSHLGEATTIEQSLNHLIT